MQVVGGGGPSFESSEIPGFPQRLHAEWRKRLIKIDKDAVHAGLAAGVGAEPAIGIAPSAMECPRGGEEQGRGGAGCQ